MVVGGEGVPDAILEVVVLAVGQVFRVAHGHLLTSVPGGGGGEKKNTHNVEPKCGEKLTTPGSSGASLESCSNIRSGRSTEKTPGT